MSRGVGARAVTVMGRNWRGGDPDTAFALRGLAGALARASTVSVLVPGPPGAPEPDGLFDLRSVGGGPEGWPEPSAAAWPAGAGTGPVLVEPDDAAAAALAAALAPGRPLLTLHPSALAAAAALDVGAGDGGPGTAAARTPVCDVGMYVPINPIAATQRHSGIGFTGYVLVLSDRAGRPDPVPPAPHVAWLTARFARAHVVVVEGGVATVWRGRARRGAVSVDSRTDLWRLVAHARAVVDLAPGRLVARECVEALRFGVPIVVPAGTAAARLAAASGGGRSYATTAELLERVDELGADGVRDGAAAAGRAFADARFGQPEHFVEATRRVLTTLDAAA